MRSFPVALVIIKFFNPSSTGSVGLNRRENDITARPGMTPIYCIVLIPTVSSKRESARVKDPNFIALSEAQADVKFLVYMNGVRRWRKSATGKWRATVTEYKERTETKGRRLIMKNYTVFARILIRDWSDHLLSEIALRIVRIVIEVKCGYYVLDNGIC